MIGRAHLSGRRVRTAIALATACMFVACGLLAMHHASEVAHVRDGRTGEAMHGLETGCDDTPTTHLHSTPEHHDGEACALADFLHQSVRPLPAIAIAVAPTAFTVLDVAPSDAERVWSGLLLA